MDRIRIKDLTVRCVIGITEDERRDRQDVLINVVLTTDTRKAGASDRLEDAVNYRTLNKRILHHVESSKHQLVETLAERIADICLTDPRVQHVEVTVEKPGALRFARSVGVEIARSRIPTAPPQDAPPLNQVKP